MVKLAGTHLATIREDKQCRTVPSLLQALEELIEVDHLCGSVGNRQLSPCYRSELKVGGKAEMIAGKSFFSDTLTPHPKLNLWIILHEVGVVPAGLRNHPAPPPP